MFSFSLCHQIRSNIATLLQQVLSLNGKCSLYKSMLNVRTAISYIPFHLVVWHPLFACRFLSNWYWELCPQTLAAKANTNHINLIDSTRTIGYLQCLPHGNCGWIATLNMVFTKACGVIRFFFKVVALWDIWIDQVCKYCAMQNIQIYQQGSINSLIYNRSLHETDMFLSVKTRREFLRQENWCNMLKDCRYPARSFSCDLMKIKTSIACSCIY